MKTDDWGIKGYRLTQFTISDVPGRIYVGGLLWLLIPAALIANGIYSHNMPLLIVGIWLPIGFIVHEAGHFMAGKFVGIQVNAFVIAASGMAVLAQYREKSKIRQCFFLSGGILANILTGLFCFWGARHPLDMPIADFLKQSAIINTFYIGLPNLIPAFGSDGALIIKTIREK